MPKRIDNHRSDAMVALADKLSESGRSLSWLAGELGYRRQTVCQWPDVPIDRLEIVSRLSGIPPSQLRPDLASLMGERD